MDSRKVLSQFSKRFHWIRIKSESRSKSRRSSPGSIKKETSKLFLSFARIRETTPAVLLYNCIFYGVVAFIHKIRRPLASTVFLFLGFVHDHPPQFTKHHAFFSLLFYIDWFGSYRNNLGVLPQSKKTNSTLRSIPLARIFHSLMKTSKFVVVWVSPIIWHIFLDLQFFDILGFFLNLSKKRVFCYNFRTGFNNLIIWTLVR